MPRVPPTLGLSRAHSVGPDAARGSTRPPQGGRHAHRTAFGLALAALIVLRVGVAQATELEDFERARAAYEAHDYPRAVELFQQLLGAPRDSVTDPLVREESRKYLAAAYVFVGDSAAAEAQFEALLTARPDYSLNPAAFPAAVVSLFESVRARREAERVAAAEASARAQLEQDAARRAAIGELLAMAREVELEVSNDPALVWVPFGVGQFQNGNSDLGLALLLAEASTLLAGLTTLAVWVPLNDAHESQGRTSAVDVGLLRGLQIANWASVGAFLSLYAIGVVEAQIGFVPRRTLRRTREVPPDFLEIFQLSLGPGGIAARFHF